MELGPHAAPIEWNEADLGDLQTINWDQSHCQSEALLPQEDIQEKQLNRSNVPFSPALVKHYRWTSSKCPRLTNRVHRGAVGQQTIPYWTMVQRKQGIAAKSKSQIIQVRYLRVFDWLMLLGLTEATMKARRHLCPIVWLFFFFSWLLLVGPNNQMDAPALSAMLTNTMERCKKLEHGMWGRNHGSETDNQMTKLQILPKQKDKSKK